MWSLVSGPNLRLCWDELRMTHLLTSHSSFCKEAVSAQCSSANPGLQSALAGFVVATTSFHLARTSFFFTSYCTLQDAMHFFCGKLVQALVGGILLFTKKDFPSAAENLQQKGFFMSGHRGSFSNFKF